MKNLQILRPLLFMLLLSQYACRTTKLSNLNRDRTMSSGEMVMQSANEGNEKYSSKTVAADSIMHGYKLTIFPLDTFQFSLDKGFKGKAMKLEITGNMEQITRIKDAVTFDAAQRNELDARLLSREVAVNSTKMKSVDKTWINWWLIGAFIGLGFVIMLVFQRFKKVLV